MHFEQKNGKCKKIGRNLEIKAEKHLTEGGKI
jgi:hypothetical protein